MLSKKVKIALYIFCIVVFLICVGCGKKNTPATRAPAENLNTDDAFFVGLNPTRNYLIIVNDNNEYIFGSEYDQALIDDLIYVSDIYGEPTPIEKGSYLAFTMLQQNLREKGTEIGFYSGYRTKEIQQEVYDYYGSLEGWAENNKVSKPGFSEHHTGLLYNIVIWGEIDGDMTWITETAERQELFPEFKIVHESLADFGFIDRYPKGKEAITGVPCEPYEIRFVGSSEVAHKIMDNGLCLEEYLNK